MEVYTVQMSSAKKVRKADMVRESLSAGIESPREGVKWIQSKYGVEFDTATWSTYKSNFKISELKRNHNSANNRKALDLLENVELLRELSKKIAKGHSLNDMIDDLVPLLESYGKRV